MATYADYANRYDRIRRLAGNLSNQITLLNSEVQRGAGTAEIQSRYNSLNNQINSSIDALNNLSEEIASSDLTQEQQDSLQNAIEATGYALLDMQQRLRGVYRQAQDNDREDRQQETENTLPRNSAGEEVENESEAQDENASTQSPALPPQTPITPNASNANEYELADPASDFGPEGGGLRQQPAANTTIKQKQTNPGGASNTDDAYDIPRETTATSSGVDDGRPPVSAEFLQKIEPTPNMLNGLTNMTYSIGIYLLDRREFVDLIISQDKKLPSKQLIIQTGGAPLGERNQWFDLDFYIEDLNITSIVGTQEVGSAHNSVLMNFTVVEPNGITFLNRLNNACIEHTGLTAATTSELAQNYLMVIRWYGYDEAGNRVTADQIFKNVTTTDQNAVAEKFIPFQIANITYKIRNQNVEYRVEATIPQTQIALSTARGSIPFNLQLVAPDVQTLLNGTFATALNEFDEGDFGDLEGNSAPTSKPNGLAGETVTQGLCEALNEHQQRLVNQGTYEVADIYEIELQELPGLKDAKLQKPGGADKKQAANKNSKSSAQQYLGSKLNYDKATRTYSVPAGQQIVQLIDLVMRSSSYITSQQNVIFDEKTGKIKAQQSKVQTVQWYRIRTQCTPIAYDNKRRDYAYRIKYTISAYQINTPRSPYYPPSAYRGTHKLYPYWFTGENTEVLDFEIDVNSNFLVTIGNDGSVDDSPQGRWPVKNSYGAPNSSQQGGTKGSSIPAANLSDRLYYYADVANNKITIVGDPDWVQQTEVLYNEKINLGPFMDDGSVNYDASEVLYEIRFNPVQDYDMTTGLSPVYENNTVKNLVGETNVAQESLVFAANRVESSFSKGAFTQTLHGTIREFEGATGGPTKGINRGNAKADENITVGSVYDTSVADIAAQQEADGLEQWPTSATGSTPKSASQPNRSIQLTPTGTKNFNIDKRLPFRDTQIGGQTVRVYGSERDLTKFVGEQAVQPKPGSTVVSDDAGTEAVFGGVGGYGKGIG